MFREKCIRVFLRVASAITLLLIAVSVNIFGQNTKIFISKIVIDDDVFFKPLPREIIIDPASSITFYYSISTHEADKKILYDISLDDQIIRTAYKRKSISFNNLEEGIYTLILEESSDSAIKAAPATIKFFVRNKVLSAEGSNDISSNNFILYILLAVVLIQLVVIMALLFRKRATGEPVEKKHIEDLTSLKENYKILKHGYDALNKRNRELKSRIKKLTKVTTGLEEANQNLMEQKETLEHKKIELEDLAKKKDELVAMTVHDIKNPAQAIHGMAELLESYDYTAKEQQQIMETIVSSSESIVSLAQEISETFANQEFEEPIKLETTSLKEIIDSVVSVNFAYAHKKKIRLINNSSDAIPNFMFDPFKIKEALDNIVGNAIKYSPKSTEVIVKSYFTNKKVTVEVRDTGVGIPENELKHIFKKGVKLSPKPTGDEKSSGLGLWIVKKIVDDHNGSVSVESEENKGSTFRVELPFQT